MMINFEEDPGAKSRTEKPDSYPDRFPVDYSRSPWAVDYPEYSPQHWEDPVLASAVWAEPASPPPEDFTSFLSQTVNENGYPLNPMGRTGITGRGLLGKWGPNHAADPIITRENPETGDLEVLLITRGDTGELAFPGGMVDPGEEVSVTAAREFKEECGVDLDFSDARTIYQGFVDDPRNTDNAWMETNAKWKHLSPKMGAAMNPVAGDDAVAVHWVTVNKKLSQRMYASHGEMLKIMIGKLV